MNKELLNTAKAYDYAVEEYVAERKAGVRVANEFVEMPATMSLLGSVRGRRILDAGCGPGLYAKKLIAKGAKVHGIDISEASLDIAMREAPKAEFQKGSIMKIPFRKKTFDIVLAALVLEHIKDWSKAFKEVYRVLKPKGVFVFSLANPVFTLRETAKLGGRKYKMLGYSQESKLQVFGDYFSERTRYEEFGGIRVPKYPKTYETVFRTLKDAGFVVVDYKDAKPTARVKKVNLRYFEIYSRLPWFCSWRVQKR